MEKPPTGIVFNIQRFSINDGPGIRTIVFLKGCSLHCIWCENPESIKPFPQLAFLQKRCIGCGNCHKTCPRGAIIATDAGRIDRDKCNDCGRCIESCPSTALKMIGEEMTVEGVLGHVLRDLKFYKRSGGGITISGGEPTYQYEFLHALLQSFKEEELHVVLEINGNLPWNKLAPLTQFVDIFYFDIKGLDPILHRQHTGASNNHILDNAQRLMASRSNVVFRLPMIPSVNTEMVQVEQLEKFLSDIGAREIHLLPYHKFGEEKLRTIHSTQRPMAIPAMSSYEAEKLFEVFQKPGRIVRIGGI